LVFALAAAVRSVANNRTIRLAHKIAQSHIEIDRVVQGHVARRPNWPSAGLGVASCLGDRKPMERCAFGGPSLDARNNNRH
jgi:hypothetical protein